MQITEPIFSIDDVCHVTMRSISTIPALILCSIALSACSLTEPQDPDPSGVRFELEKTTFSLDETIEARFINDSEETIYIVSFGSRASVLQKLGDEGWTSLFLPDVGCPAVISYRPF